MALQAQGNKHFALSDASKFAGNTLRVAGAALVLYDLSNSAYNNFTNDNFTTFQQFGYTAVDWGASIGTLAIAAAIGGPLGFAVAVGIWYILESEGGKDYIKSYIN